MKTRAVLRFLPFQSLGAKNASLFFIVVSCFVFIFSVLNPGLSGKIQMHAVDVVAPVLEVVNTPFEDAADFVRAVSGLAEMQEENLRLQEENKKLREWYQAALLLQDQNKELQTLLNVKVEPSHTFVTARVIADSGNSYVKSLLVRAGELDGVSKGDAVLSGKGLIGRVIDTGNGTSRVLLLTDINSRIPVYIEGVEYKAIMAGSNTDLPYILHVDQKKEITEGARVITSGDGGVFPYGLPIGRVVYNNDGKPEIELNADMKNLRYIRIVQSNGKVETLD